MPHKVAYIIAAALAAGIGISVLHYTTYQDQPEPEQMPLSDEMPSAGRQGMEDHPIIRITRAAIKTNHGDITIELFPKEAPLTVENFLKLSRQGFYDGTKFHRVIKGFMIQGGDPNSRDSDWSDDGAGGPGYTFKDEINAHKIVRGAVAMANAGSDTNGSQFFIVTADAAPWLDGKHTVFGQVINSMDVVDKIENVATDKSRGDHPTQDIIIRSIEIAAE